MRTREKRWKKWKIFSPPESEKMLDKEW